MRAAFGRALYRVLKMQGVQAQRARRWMMAENGGQLIGREIIFWHFSDGTLSSHLAQTNLWYLWLSHGNIEISVSLRM